MKKTIVDSLHDQEKLVNKASHKEQYLQKFFMAMCIILTIEILSLFWKTSTPAIIFFAAQVPILYTLWKNLSAARNHKLFEQFVMYLIKDVQANMYDPKSIPGYIAGKA